MANYTFGTDILINKVDENIPHNTASSFRYNSLADFQAGNPIFFNKKFSLDPNDDGRLKYTSTEIAFFVQGEYDLTDNLKLELGLRWDGTMFTPDQNPTNTKLTSIIYRGKGLVNNSKLRDFNNVQPRINLTWDRKGDGSEIAKLGAGFFSSQFTTQPYTFTLGNSGSRFVEVSTQEPTQLAAIHANYTADGGWSDLDNQITLTEYSAITGQNANDIAADIVVLDPDFDMPMTFKVSASYHKFFNSWFRLGGGLYYNNTKNVPYFSNINLKETGANPLDGRATYTNGNNPSFGKILVFQNSDWRATFYAATLEAYAKLPNGGNVSFSYTKSASKGFSYYNAGGGFDGGRPLTYQYDSYSVQAANWHDGNSIPNKIVFSFVSPEVKGFTLSGSLVAGQFGRFSAQSGVNTGAAGQNLAYIPTDAEVTGTKLADPSNLGFFYNPYEGFAQMLSSTSPEYRDYINENRGGFGDFNGGAQPWSYSTNMSLIKGFTFAEKHKLTARMDVFNVLNLFGGYADGAFNVVSNTNLINENNGKYSVNKKAGRYVKGGDQFRVQFGLKYEF